MISQTDLEALAGTELPGSTFQVEAYEEWLLRDVVLAPPTAASEPLHPLWAFIASVRAMGVTLEEMFARCGASSNDGPMLGGSEIDYVRPLEVGVEYRTSARIESAQRKEGRRTGTFDIVTVAVDVTAPNGQPVATIKDSYVLPRRLQ